MRDLLKTELANRCRKNSGYSLRAFAKSLELSPAFVSKLLRGDRPFTQKTIQLLARKLALSPQQIDFYNRTQKTKESLRKVKDAAFRQISLDQFQLIADLTHYAILELITVEGFNSSPAWIAKRLELNIHEVSESLDRLVRLGLIHVGSDGNLELIEENNTIVGPEVTSSATRRQQTQILERALQALDEIPIEERSQSAITMAIPTERLDEAKQIIAEFRRKMAALLQRPGKRNAVYQLSISFFPLTKKENSK